MNTAKVIVALICLYMPMMVFAIEDHPMPICETVLISEDFEGCDVGSWIGSCNGWQTWANGSNPSYFYVSDEYYVSGSRSLHTSGSGTCWEGSAYKSIAGGHIFAKAMIRASGSGPQGCHGYQNGFCLQGAGCRWSFEMPNSAYGEGLMCFASGGGHFTAIEGFSSAAGQWYEVAIEVNPHDQMAHFWLDGSLVWSTEYNGGQVSSVWMRSGEGHGWFDDVLVCEVPTIVEAYLTSTPSSGTVPFNTQMSVTLTNLYTEQSRTIAGRINATLASGSYYPNWRAGYTNVAAGDSFVTTWNMNIPNYSAVIGSNLFVLVAEDVTPAPYNQPPYPPAGDTDSVTCTVTGIAP